MVVRSENKHARVCDLVVTAKDADGETERALGPGGGGGGGGGSVVDLTISPAMKII